MKAIRDLVAGLFGGKQPRSEADFVAAIERLETEAQRADARAVEHRDRHEFLLSERAVGVDGLDERIEGEAQAAATASREAAELRSGIAGLRRRLAEFRDGARESRVVEHRAQVALRAKRVLSAFSKIAEHVEEAGVLLQAVRADVAWLIAREPDRTRNLPIASEDRIMAAMMDALRIASGGPTQTFGLRTLAEVQASSDLRQMAADLGALAVESAAARAEVPR